MPVVDLSQHIDPSWDLTLLQIIQWVDGVRFIKRIAAEAAVEVGLVISCVEQLLRADLVKLGPCTHSQARPSRRTAGGWQQQAAEERRAGIEQRRGSSGNRQGRGKGSGSRAKSPMHIVFTA